MRVGGVSKALGWRLAAAAEVVGYDPTCLKQRGALPLALFAGEVALLRSLSVV